MGLKEEILKTLESSDVALSTAEIAAIHDIRLTAAYRRLTRLKMEGKVRMFRAWGRSFRVVRAFVLVPEPFFYANAYWFVREEQLVKRLARIFAKSTVRNAAYIVLKRHLGMPDEFVRKVQEEVEKIRGTWF